MKVFLREREKIKEGERIFYAGGYKIGRRWNKASSVQG